MSAAALVRLEPRCSIWTGGTVRLRTGWRTMSVVAAAYFSKLKRNSDKNASVHQGGSGLIRVCTRFWPVPLSLCMGGEFECLSSV